MSSINSEIANLLKLPHIGLRIEGSLGNRKVVLINEGEEKTFTEEQIKKAFTLKPPALK